MIFSVPPERHEAKWITVQKHGSRWLAFNDEVHVVAIGRSRDEALRKFSECMAHLDQYVAEGRGIEPRRV